MEEILQAMAFKETLPEALQQTAYVRKLLGETGKGGASYALQKHSVRSSYKLSRLRFRMMLKQKG